MEYRERVREQDVTAIAAKIVQECGYPWAEALFMAYKSVDAYDIPGMRWSDRAAGMYAAAAMGE